MGFQRIHGQLRHLVDRCGGAHRGGRAWAPRSLGGAVGTAPRPIATRRACSCLRGTREPSEGGLASRDPAEIHQQGRTASTARLKRARARALSARGGAGAARRQRLSHPPTHLLLREVPTLLQGAMPIFSTTTTRPRTTTRATRTSKKALPGAVCAAALAAGVVGPLGPARGLRLALRSLRRAHAAHGRAASGAEGTVQQRPAPRRASTRRTTTAPPRSCMPRRREEQRRAPRTRGGAAASRTATAPRRSRWRRAGVTRAARSARADADAVDAGEAADPAEPDQRARGVIAIAHSRCRPLAVC